MHIRLPNIRLLLVCLVSASVGWPIAVIRIAKTLLLLGGVTYLLLANDTGRIEAGPRDRRYTPRMILVVLAVFALSLLWTKAGQAEALASLGKYGKLLLIPLIWAMLKDRKEVLYALAAFAAMQSFMLLSSWMLFVNISLPWATSPTAAVSHAPFSSYLDEGIMTALFAAICWHLRRLAPGKYGPACAIGIAALALGNVFFVFNGRSGHMVAIALISLAAMWELPPKRRLLIIVLPFLIMTMAIAVSPKVKGRLTQATSEIAAFSPAKGENVVSGTSSGIRLHFWHRAIQSIAQSPVIGSGVGSWTTEFNRLEIQRSPTPQKLVGFSNPHQEYLQWGVQLGIPGIALFLGLMAAMVYDTRGMDTMAQRAALSAITALAVACLFNSSLYDGLIGDFFCVAIGLLLALGLRHPEPEKAPQPLAPQL
ncbi:MAG: O-antigen polymerase [Polaromonas sp.]|nr:O-antigen polymerase [Polaromonas sp.]